MRFWVALNARILASALQMSWGSSLTENSYERFETAIAARLAELGKTAPLMRVADMSVSEAVALAKKVSEEDRVGTSSGQPVHGAEGVICLTIDVTMYTMNLLGGAITRSDACATAMKTCDKLIEAKMIRRYPAHRWNYNHDSWPMRANRRRQASTFES